MSQQLSFPLTAMSSAADVLDLHQRTAIYTTGHVVENLLDRLDWPARDGRLLDPSAGDGAFVVAALTRIETPPDDMASVRRVTGWEIYPGAVVEAREAVAGLLVKRGWTPGVARRAAATVVREGDFLTEPFEVGAYSVLAGNPPYLRFGHLPESFKGLYGTLLPVHARGDLLHGFLDRCSSMLADDGAMGFVTADRWLFNETAAGLRAMLGKRVGLRHVSRLDPATSFYHPKRRVGGTPPRIHPVVVVMSARDRCTGAITRRPLSPDGTRSDAAGPTLRDIATVRIAPWLDSQSSRGMFVVDEVTAARFPRESILPAVDTDDIDPTTDVLRTPRRYAVLTEPKHEPTGAVRLHLRSWASKVQPNKRSRSYWMPPERITLDLSQPGLLIPRIANRLRVIDLPAGVLPINHNLHVVSATGETSLAELKEILLSDKTQAWIRAYAPRLESGYLSITTMLLRRMPV